MSWTPSSLVTNLWSSSLGPVFVLVASTVSLFLVSILYLFFQPLGGKGLFGRTRDARLAVYGELGGDPTHLNPLLEKIPSWTLASKKTLSVDYPFTEHFELLKLHSELQSPIVRTGPNQVHVSDSASHSIIFGIGSKYAKGLIYDLFDLNGHKTLFSHRFKEDHAQRRRLLNHAFTSSSVNTMRSFTSQKLVTLVNHLNLTGIQNRQPSDMYTHFQTLFGDIAIKFGFAHDGEMVETAKINSLLTNIRGATKASKISRQLVPKLERFPFLTPLAEWFLTPDELEGLRATRSVNQKVHSIVASFLQRGGNESEALQKIISATDPDTGNGLDPVVIVAEARSIVIAGINTSANFMTYFTWQVAKNPDWMDLILSDLRTLIPQSPLEKLLRSKAEKDADLLDLELVDPGMIAELPHVSAFVREVFRFYPATVKPLPRIVPQGGASFHGHYLPAGTEITTAAWVIHRDREIYGDDAETFNPNRWIQADSQRLQQMKRNLIHFSSGVRVCIGKHLAIDSIHLTIAAIFRNLRPAKTITSDQDMTFVGFFTGQPKGHGLDIQWELVQD